PHARAKACHGNLSHFLEVSPGPATPAKRTASQWAGNWLDDGPVGRSGRVGLVRTDIVHHAATHSLGASDRDLCRCRGDRPGAAGGADLLLRPGTDGSAAALLPAAHGVPPSICAFTRALRC